MKKLVAILLMSLLATSAFALADDGQNSIGIYFDVAGDETCVEGQIGFGAPTWVYIVLANPTMPNINAYEFGWQGDFGALPEAAVVVYLQSLSLGDGPIDVADPPVALGGREAIVGFASPMPTTSATLLHQIWLIHNAPGSPFSLWLVGAGAQEFPRVNDSDAGVLVNCELSTGALGVPMLASMAAGMCAEFGPVAVESDTWGGVKSLYR